MAEELTDDALGCPAEVTLDFLTGKWRPMIIYWLLHGPIRFNELQRRLRTVTHRTLSKTLKEMEADGLVIRRDYGEIPPRVDYSLTPRSRSLEPILREMERWARDDETRRVKRSVSGSSLRRNSPMATQAKEEAPE
jgi:DNA-binding HxlR family transcriptional regulator